LIIRNILFRERADWVDISAEAVEVDLILP
jgi:hypothetical protein